MLLLLLSLAAPPADLARLQGEWLIDTCDEGTGRDGTTWYWQARLTVAGDVATLTEPNRAHGRSWPSRLKLNPTATPKRFDWQTGPVSDLASRLWPPPFAPGIYRFDGDAFEICAAREAGFPRPSVFVADLNSLHAVARLRRWTGAPGAGLKTGTLTVLDPDGQPLAGAVARKRESEQVLGTTAADGTLTADVVDNTDRVIVTHAGRKLIAFAEATPAGWHHGLTVTAVPAVRLTGRVVGPPAGTGLRVSVRPPNGKENARGFGYADPKPDADGRFACDCPPGDWLLDLTAYDFGGRRVPFTVPPGRAAFDLGDVVVKEVGRPD